MRTYHTNYTYAYNLKKAGCLHDTLKAANAEKRELNAKYTDIPLYVVARLIAPDQYGTEKFYGYYVCLGDKVR